MSKTLLFVVNVDWFFMSHRLPIAIEAMKADYDVHLAAGITDRKEELERLGLTVHSLDIERKGEGFVSNFRLLFQLVRLFNYIKPDVVHLVTIKPVLFGGIASRLMNVRSVVISFSGMGYVYVAKGVMADIRRVSISFFYKIALRHRNLRIIFQNEQDRDLVVSFSNIPPENIVMIRGSGVDLNLFTEMPLPGGRAVVMMASRLLVDKGVREYVEAARIIKRSGYDARFILVGDPDNENPATIQQNEIFQWAEEGVIEWWRHREDMDQVIGLSNLFVLPSYREGLPKVLLEAAASGRAVVTTDVPGCRDAIEDGVTGVLVPSRDAGKLADAIKGLLDNPDICREMGCAGRELAEQEFDVRSVVKQHMRIYQEVIQYG